MYHPKNAYYYQSNINHLAEPEFGRTKKIHVWEYGDSYNKNHEIFINPNCLRTWNSILKYLTDVINPTFGAVRKVLSLENKKTIGCFAELDNNGKYVAIGAVNRIKVRLDSYKTVSELNLLAESNKTVKRLYSGEIGPPEFKNLLEATKRRLTIIFILVNGRPCQTPTKLVLTKKDLRSWEVILEFLSKVMDVPDGIQSVYTVFGWPLSRPDQLQHGYVYVAMPFNERFVKLDYLSIFAKKKGFSLKIAPASRKGSKTSTRKDSNKALKLTVTSEVDVEDPSKDLKVLSTKTVSPVRSFSSQDVTGLESVQKAVPADVQSTKINFFANIQSPIVEEVDAEVGTIDYIKKTRRGSIEELIENKIQTGVGYKLYTERSRNGKYQASESVSAANGSKRLSEQDGESELKDNFETIRKYLAQNIDKAVAQNERIDIKGYLLNKFETAIFNDDSANDGAKEQESFEDLYSSDSGSISHKKKSSTYVDAKEYLRQIEEESQNLEMATEALIHSFDIAESTGVIERKDEMKKSLENLPKIKDNGRSQEQLSEKGRIFDVIKESLTEALLTSLSSIDTDNGSIQMTSHEAYEEYDEQDVEENGYDEPELHTENDVLSTEELVNNENVNVNLGETGGIINAIVYNILEKATQTDRFIPVENDLLIDTDGDIKVANQENIKTDASEGKTSIDVTKPDKKRPRDNKDNVKANGNNDKSFPKINGTKKDGGITAALSENNLCSKSRHVPSIHIRNRTDINFCGFSKSKKGIVCQDNKKNSYQKLYLNKSFSSPDRTSSSSEGEIREVKRNRCCFCIHRKKSNKMNKILEDEEKSVSSKSAKTGMDTKIVVGLMESETGETTERTEYINKEMDVSHTCSVISIDSIEGDGVGVHEMADEVNESCGCAVDEAVSRKSSTISADSIDGARPS